MALLYIGYAIFSLRKMLKYRTQLLVCSESEAYRRRRCCQMVTAQTTSLPATYDWLLGQHGGSFATARPLHCSYEVCPETKREVNLDLWHSPSKGRVILAKQHTA